jgi:Reverse transcriptase (RNA-dependent DNA polymerase)
MAKGLIPEAPKHTDDIDDNDDDYSVTYLYQIATPTTVTPPTVPLPIPNNPDANDNDNEPPLNEYDVYDTDLDNNTEDVSSTSKTSTMISPSKKLTNAMRKLTCSFNPVATKIYNNAVGNDDVTNSISAEGSDEGNSENNSQQTNDYDNSDESSNIIVDRYAIEYALSATISEEKPDNIPMSSYKDVYEIPDNFDPAYNHPIKWQCIEWREAIQKELDKMKQYDVWNVVPRTSIPSNCRCVKHKWILDIKRNGTFVASGYSQVPGIDFMDAYSPVINDVVFRIMIVIQMIWKLNSKIIDVETAFLHGELDQEFYMDCPK